MGNLLGHVGFYDFSELTGVRYETLFDSLDGWYKNPLQDASIAFSDGILVINGGTDPGASAQLQKLMTFTHWSMSFSKKRLLRTHIDFSFESGGGEDNYFGTPCKGPAMGFGLRFKADKIVGWSADEDGNVTEITLIGSLTAPYEQDHTYEIIFFPGLRIQFSVDGFWKGNILTHLPTGVDEAFCLIEYYIDKAVSLGHNLLTSSLLFFQDS